MRFRRLMSCIMITILVCMSIPVTVFGAAKDESSDTISIIFSHDMHSHLEKFGKIKTVIDTKLKENDATFVLDGGDIAMGTPYQTVFDTEASEIRLMGAVGYDATTLGNHEFDFRSAGLTKMLKKAAASKDPLPQLVISNIDWESTLADDELAADGEKLKAALEKFGAKKYTVLEKGGVKIAVFGIFGKESASYAPESGTLFLDPVETARDVVEEIKAHEKVDMIVCLSHSGTYADNPEGSEDEILANSVDGIDLIVSGHSHTYLDEPLIENGTVIASCGQYNDNIGEITFKKSGKGYAFDTYKLQPLDNTVKSDAKTDLKIAKFKGKVDEKYFSKYGFKWNQVLAKNTIDFTPIDKFGLDHTEDTLGNLIADSYIYGIKSAEGKDYEPVAVSVVPAGVVRESFDKGKITTADAFNVLSLGVGADGTPGYPLVSVYLTGKELKLVAEIDATVSDLMQPARLYMSGLNYTYNPNRMLMNRAYDIYLEDEKGEPADIENGKLYRVCADLYSAQMLATVNSMSHGILSLVPKDKDGHAIDDFEQHIIHNSDGSELKEWYALASYIDSFKKDKFPKQYKNAGVRKVQDNKAGVISFLKKPNKFMIIIMSALVLVLAVLLLIITLIVKLHNSRRYGRGAVRRKDQIFGRRRRRRRW